MNAPAPYLPESWLARLGGADASGWLTAFQSDGAKAVADLLWNRFYFGPLNLIERGQLLAGWLEALGDDHSFASELDLRCAEWVQANWGRFDEDGVTQASAWICLASVVEFSARLNPPSRLAKTAEELLARFDERERFLGSFSTAPAADPLGFYLAAVAEFQGEDRSLAGFWHRLCDLPDGVPAYHARYALLGLRRLKAADRLEDGTLRVEVVLGLLRVANASDRLVRERGLNESVAKTTFRRVATQVAAAYPNSPRWPEHGLAAVLEMAERPRKWVLEAVPPLAEAFRKEQAKANRSHTRAARSIPENPDWRVRGQSLSKALRAGVLSRLPEAKALIEEERRYAEATGDHYPLVRSLSSFAPGVTSSCPKLALAWAEEAMRWAPNDAFTWTTIKDVLLRQRKLDRALRFAWVAWKRFPENVVVRNGLAEVLKAAGRYREAGEVYGETIETVSAEADRYNHIVACTGLAEVLKTTEQYSEAESLYRQTIKRFPENLFARNGLADTFRRAHRWADAEAIYRESIAEGFVDTPTFVGLAYLLLRHGEAGRAEALNLLSEALRLDPRDPHVLALKQKLAPAQGTDLETIAEEWDAVADEFLATTPITEDEGDEIAEAEPEAASQSSGDLLDLESAFAQPDQSAKPPFGQIQARAVPAPARVRRPPAVDLLELAAMLAEASFFRHWAARSLPEAAAQHRDKAAALLATAERLAPNDPQVLAERAALESAQIGSETAASHLTIELDKHPGSAPLLVLKARLDREEARRAQRRLSDGAMADLLQAPNRLRDLDAAFAPVFHMQRGLAALALLDGAERLEQAAESFTSFRHTLSRRAKEERIDREASRDARARTQLRFHEWLQRTADAALFSGFSEPERVRIEEVPTLEQSVNDKPFLVEEIEEATVGRVAVAGV